MSPLERNSSGSDGGEESPGYRVWHIVQRGSINTVELFCYILRERAQEYQEKGKEL